MNAMTRLEPNETASLKRARNHQPDATIAAAVDRILVRRKPHVARIKATGDLLAQVRKALAGMCSGRPLESSAAKSYADVHGEIAQVQSDLNRLHDRYARDSLCLGIAGQARQGKSRLLQSLTGLSDQEIPCSAYSFTTGAPSVVVHSDNPLTQATVEFLTEADFLRSNIQPVYRALGWDDAPQTLDDFAVAVLPSVEESGQATAHRNVLLSYQENLEQYRHLIGRAPQAIAPEDIVRYVAQFNPVDPDDVYHAFRAVRLVQIATPFPMRDVGRIAVTDVPGLDEPKPGEAQRLIQQLADRVDMVVLLKKPRETGDGWNRDDVGLYQLAKETVSPLNLQQISALVLNRHADGRSDAICELLRRSAPVSGLLTADTFVANCADPHDVRENLLQPLLQYMAQHIETIDRTAIAAVAERVRDLATRVVSLCSHFRKDRANAVDSHSPEAAYSRQFRRFEKHLKSQLVNLETQLKDVAGDAHPAFSDALASALQRAEQDKGLPTPDELVLLHNQEKDWRIVFGKQMHRIRTHLTAGFQSLDTTLRTSVEDVKSSIVGILKGAGLGQLDPAEDSQFLRTLLAELNPDAFPELYQGFHDLNEFNLLYRGLIQHRIRSSLENLYQDTTEFALTSSSLAEIGPEHLIDLLANAHEDSLYRLREALQAMVSEPGVALHAVVEEFVDRIGHAEGAMEQWRVFLDERKTRLWPDEFAWHQEVNRLRVHVEALVLAAGQMTPREVVR